MPYWNEVKREGDEDFIEIHMALLLGAVSFRMYSSYHSILLDGGIPV